MTAEPLLQHPNHISNWHMSFEEIQMPGESLLVCGSVILMSGPDGSAEITFLYKLTRGLAEASFGVWCAR